MPPLIRLRPNRDKPVRNRHPWIFSGGIAEVKDAAPGDIVRVLDYDGDYLATGYYNPTSQIQVRLLSWKDEEIASAWWRERISAALSFRTDMEAKRKKGNPVAYRLVNAENDFLPGVIIDYYAGWVVLQALTLFIDQNKQLLSEIITDLIQPQGIFERSDVDVRKREGLKPHVGNLWGSEPPEKIQIAYDPSTNFWVDVRSGHKTGFYLDQKSNHLLLRDLLKQESLSTASLLNCFAYTGAFTVMGLQAGNVHAVSVDSSRDALELAEANIILNTFGQRDSNISYDLIQADCFAYLRDAVDRSERYDCVILDPPKFAHNKQQIERAARGYKDLNMHALQLIKPGGYLLTFSCSGAVSSDLFQKIVFGALADTNRQAQIVRRLGANHDHPTALTFPEGEYLKGLLLRIV